MSCTINLENQKGVDIAKQAVKKAFQLSLAGKIDSFKILMPNVVWWKWSDDYIKMRMRPLKILAKNEGVPSTDELQSFSYSSSDVKLYTIKYIPKSSKTLDSIVFEFNKYDGNAHLTFFEVYENPNVYKNIYTH